MALLGVYERCDEEQNKIMTQDWKIAYALQPERQAAFFPH